MTEDENLLGIFHKVRYGADSINSQNFEEFLIKGSTLHNLIVMTLAFTSNLVQSYNSYIESIQDPVAVFIEMVVRYGAFRHFVLSIEVQIF